MVKIDPLILEQDARFLYDPYLEGNPIPKAISQAEKNKLIKSIPNDTYSEIDIEILVYAIKKGYVAKKANFPEPRHDGNKVSLEFVSKKKC
jgi:hypothetical protein